MTFPAHKVVVDLGLNICGSRLKRVVRRFVDVMRGGGGPDA